jgi:hypothetical protein
MDEFKTPKFVATCYCSRFIYLHFLICKKIKSFLILIVTKRKSGYYVFNAFFLIFLITLSAMTVFSIDCKMPQSRLQTSYTLLLTSVSFKWVVNRYLPTVSYLTSLDKYAIISIFFQSLLSIWHSLVAYCLEYFFYLI